MEYDVFYKPSRFAIFELLEMLENLEKVFLSFWIFYQVNSIIR